LSGGEHIFFPRPSQIEQIYRFSKGTTVSLIPIRGAAAGISTKHLMWELGDLNAPLENRVTVLDKNFVGLSNLMTKSWFKLRYDSGSLLCIISQS
jgi:hypothetical protein